MKKILGIAANKSDLFCSGESFDEKGREYAKSINAIEKKTSAISECGGFDELINELLLKYLNSTVLDSTESLSITLSIENAKNNTKKVCCSRGKKKNNSNNEKTWSSVKNRQNNEGRLI